MNKKENNQIPDIDIINLDQEPSPAPGTDTTENANTDIAQESSDLQEDELFEEEQPAKKKFSFRSLLNLHTAFLAFLVISVLVIVFRFQNWGVRIDLEEIFKDGQGTYEDTLDLMLPAPTPENSTAIEDDVTTILCFGNNPFADDRDSEDNLANLIAAQTGANVINCSVSDSYIAAQHLPFDANVSPMDAFNLYWLAHQSMQDNPNLFLPAFEALGEDLPEEAMYVYETLRDIDLNTVDVIAIMYDATDYLLGHEMYNDDNDEDVQQFTGNLEASINLLSANYPHIHFIVLSPTYAFAVNEEGEYVSSDMYRYGQDVLSTYVIKQYGSCASLGVTFVDNLYGTITEDNATEYLTDNLHLNVEGRKLVAQRFVDALNYYNRD